jgi:UPF0755 protein
MKNLGKILSVGLVITIIPIVLLGYYAYDLFIGYPDNSPSSYELVVDNTTSYKGIAKKLQDAKVIKNEWIFLQKAKDYQNSLALGKYTLALPADNNDILSQLSQQSIALKGSGKNSSFSFLIKEGATLDEIVDNLSSKTSGTKYKVNPDEFREYLKNSDNFDRVKYPFLPEKLGCSYGDPNKCAKYYPEGYMYPATYDLDTNGDYKDHIVKILDAYKKRVYPSLAGLDSKQIYDITVMASVIEKESAYGKRDLNDPAVREVLRVEREGIASTFRNREKIGMMWGSNPTVQYGTPYRLCEQTIVIPNCVFLDDPRIVNNKYNTYKNQRPIAPIASPSLDCLKATMTNTKTDYLYFIGDNEGKTRFANSSAGHEKNIKDVQNGR